MSMMSLAKYLLILVFFMAFTIGISTYFSHKFNQMSPQNKQTLLKSAPHLTQMFVTKYTRLSYFDILGILNTITGFSVIIAASGNGTMNYHDPMFLLFGLLSAVIFILGLAILFPVHHIAKRQGHESEHSQVYNN